MIRVFCLIIFIFTSCHQPPPKPAVVDLMAQSQQSLVSIGTVDASGTFTSEGMGIILSRDGHIITHRHVIAANPVGAVQLQNGAHYFYSQVLEIDPHYDLALIKIDAKTHFSPAHMADSGAVLQGQTVTLINKSQTAGTIKGTQGDIADKKIQFTTSSVSTNKNGGILLNEQGQVLGLALSADTQNSKVQLALPIHFAKALLYRRTISDTADNQLNPEETHDIASFLPVEAKLLNALKTQTLDILASTQSYALPLDTINKTNYDAYQKTQNYLDAQMAKSFSYLIRQDSFAKVVNAIKGHNPQLVTTTYVEILPKQNTAQKISELTDYFTNPYYYQILQCQLVTPKRTLQALSIEDYGKNGSACLDHTDDYLKNPGTDSFARCTSMDGTTAASSCIKRENAYALFESYFNNLPSDHLYLTGPAISTGHPQRIIYFENDATVRQTCQKMKKTYMREADAQCIEPQPKP